MLNINPMAVTDLTAQSAVLRSWKRGRIVVRDGRLIRIERRSVSWPTTILRVWWHTRFRPGNPDECVLDYRTTRTGGFAVLEFIWSGPATRFATLRHACQTLDEIARIRQCVAIFAHVSTTAISDRFLMRWGWSRHAESMNGRHWVKRFYGHDTLTPHGGR